MSSSENKTKIAVNIVDKDNPILREKALRVPVEDILSKKIKKIIDDMKKALASQDDGIAIAAPQIGESIRIFVVSGKALALVSGKEERVESDRVFINPEIVKKSKETEWAEEGCLSVRYLYGKVKRSKKATIRAYGEAGQKFELGASGLIAQIFQHEVDHLEGVLFIDKAKQVENLPPHS